eukprot:TRINITY_DN5345_c0_g1_i1.p1 TRINITY_DN5345_c0_g1~~TRINITY_DN5345_c0_g1_i1.p1  ORF type:complete len:458 (+),score=131.37 TRINITY_DN5345_c0_g1_i1:192-1565(+)
MVLRDVLKEPILISISLLLNDEEATFPLQVDATQTVSDVKALVELQAGVPVANQVVVFNNAELTDQSVLKDKGVKDQDLLIVVQRPPQLLQQPQAQGGFSQRREEAAKELRDYVLANPDILRQIQHNNPTLAEAVLTNNLNKIAEIQEEQTRVRNEKERARLEEIERLNADPFDLEAQAKIAEHIRMEKVNENMENAMEHSPESFGSVIMLYVDCIVNNVPVKAFVDSGAQMTIMSESCASRCNIMHLMDTRWSGIASGVGTARILGRVHLAPIKLGNSFFPSSFTILEGQKMDFLIGLDYLKRHQCNIDLKSNVLHIGDELVPFLPEKDIPLHFRNETVDPEELEKLKKPSSNTTTTTTTPNTLTPKPTTTPTPTLTNTAPKPATTTNAPQPIATPSSQPSIANNPPLRPPYSYTPNENSIQHLTQLGASREEAIRLLTQYRGNLEMASNALFDNF